MYRMLLITLSIRIGFMVFVPLRNMIIQTKKMADLDFSAKKPPADWRSAAVGFPLAAASFAAAFFAAPATPHVVLLCPFVSAHWHIPSFFKTKPNFFTKNIADLRFLHAQSHRFPNFLQCNIWIRFYKFFQLFQPFLIQFTMSPRVMTV